jgi:hypothetical protein
MENPFKSRANYLLVKLLANERARAVLLSEVAQYLAGCACQTGTFHCVPKINRIEVAFERSVGGLEIAIKEASESNTRGFRGGWVSSWALGKLVRNHRIRIGRKKCADILEALGYKRVGRAGPILAEDGQRPILYRMRGVPDGFGDYEKAQGYPMTG